jgi:hypothetical protein
MKATRTDAAVALLAILPALAALRTDIEWDTWWHLRAGQWVVEHRDVPSTDPFSQLGRDTDRPWVAYSWLYEVALFELYERFGLPGVVLLRFALAAAAVACLARLAKTGPDGLLGLALAILALTPLLNDRPWLVTIAFTCVTLDAVANVRAGRPARAYCWLPAVFALWANLHVQFVIGLGVLALAAASPWIDRTFLRSGGHRDGRPLALLALGCALATLLNPYHVRLYGVVWEYATQPAALRLVAELSAPDFRGPGEWAAVVLLGWAAYALGRRPKASSYDVLLLVAATFCALRMRRDIWFGAAAALAVLRPDPADRRSPWGVVRTFAGVGLIGFGMMSAGSIAFQPEKRFPVAAAAHVREQGYAGPLFNDFNWGGYLIWALPNYPVSIDGRTNVYGDERLSRSMATWQGLPGWEDDPALAAAGVVIADRDRALTELLRLRPARWCVAYEDQRAVVFVAIYPPKLGAGWGGAAE